MHFPLYARQSMIDVSTEKLITLPEAARAIPPARGGKKTSISTILRWITCGTKAPSGLLVRLEGCRIGERWMTSFEAIQRFAERLTPKFDEAPAPPRTVAKRKQASDRAAKDLE